MGLDLTSRMLIEWQCTSLTYKYAYCMDTRDVEGMVGVYADDGAFESVGGSAQGREQLRVFYSELMRNAPSGVIARHVITNHHFIDVQDDRAEAIFFNIGYVKRQDSDDNAFVNGRLFEARDVYVPTDDGWRIKKRVSTPVFALKAYREQLDEIKAKIAEAR